MALRKLLVVAAVIAVVAAFLYIGFGGLFVGPSCTTNCTLQFGQPLPDNGQSDLVVTGGPGTYTISIVPDNTSNPSLLVFRVRVTNLGTDSLSGLYFQFKNVRDGSTWLSTDAADSNSGMTAVFTAIHVNRVYNGVVQGKTTTFDLGPTSPNGGFDRADFQFRIETNLHSTSNPPPQALLGRMTVVGAPSADSLTFNAPR